MKNKRMSVFVLASLLAVVFLSAFVSPAEPAPRVMNISALTMVYGNVFKIDKFGDVKPGTVQIWIDGQEIILLGEHLVLRVTSSMTGDHYWSVLSESNSQDIRPGLAIISADTSDWTMTVVPDVSSAKMVSAATLENQQVEVVRLIDHPREYDFGILAFLADGRVVGVDYSLIQADKYPVKGFLHYEIDQFGFTSIELSSTPRDVKKDARAVQLALEQWDFDMNWPNESYTRISKSDSMYFPKPRTPKTACDFLKRYWDNYNPISTLKIDPKEVESLCGEMSFSEWYHELDRAEVTLSKDTETRQLRLISVQKRKVEASDLIRSDQLSRYGITMTDNECPGQPREDQYSNPSTYSSWGSRLFLINNGKSLCALPGEYIQMMDATTTIDLLEMHDFRNFHAFLVPDWPAEEEK